MTRLRRICLALAVFAAASVAAIYVHAIQSTSSNFSTAGASGTVGHLLVADHQRPSWTTPVAIAIAISGVSAAIAIVRAR